MEKFLMMYTCKICQGRNAQMVSKVAYRSGMVISTCKHCKSHHLIADNEGKLDMPEYGKKIEDYLKEKGERVQKLQVTPRDLEDNYLVDKDGVLTLVPKMSGQPAAPRAWPATRKAATGWMRASRFRRVRP
jgi:transcription elongation factor Elf1